MQNAKKKYNYNRSVCKDMSASIMVISMTPT